MDRVAHGREIAVEQPEAQIGPLLLELLDRQRQDVRREQRRCADGEGVARLFRLRPIRDIAASSSAR
jgi:hypothetical protein